MPQLQRQALGCGYEPRTDRVHLTVWQPPGGKHGYRGPNLTVCAGYTVNLPEVQEAHADRFHWKHGAIVAACDGEKPTREHLDAIVAIDLGYSRLEGWCMSDDGRKGQ